MVHNNKRKKTPTQRLSPQSGIRHHAHGAPDNLSNEDQEINLVSEPNQLNEERMVAGLHPTPWVEEHYGQRKTRHTQHLWMERELINVHDTDGTKDRFGITRCSERRC